VSLAPLIEFSLDTSSQQSAQLEFIVNAAAAAGGTSLVFALATNDPIGAAMKPAAQSRVIGGRLSIDKGDGALTAVKGSELGDSIQITGTLNDFGGRTLTFSRFGKDFSPFISSALRELRAVSFSIVRGVRGNTATKKLFDGHFRSTKFQPYPPIAAITCQDASLKFAQTPFFYTLAPGSGRTRLDILLDIFTQYVIPYGRLDFPNNTGGTVFKAINEGGSRSVLDFLNDFIAPIGCRANWKDNAINIGRPGMHIGAGKPGNGSVIKFWTPDIPVRTLNPSNIRSLSIQPPNSDAPNAIRFTALTFAYIGRTGQYSVVKDVLSNGVYAPLVAVNKQDKTTGAITATGLTSSLVSRPVHRVITTTNYNGGTVVSQTISEYGWYAPKAARRKQAAGTGALSWNDLFDCWQFADGTWRTTAQEDFQEIRRTVLTRTFDANGYLIQEITAVYQFAGTEIPLGTVAAGVETPALVYVTEDGHAWSGAAETLLGEQVRRDYHSDSSNALSTIYSLIISNSVTQYVLSSLGNGSTTNYFGPFSSHRYGYFPFSPATVWQTAETFAQIDETQYRDTVTLQGTPSYVPDTFTRPARPSSTIKQGSIPQAEQLTSQQKAQPTSILLNDKVRQVFNNGKEVLVMYQNDWCETEGELITCALELMRDIASPRVSIETDFDAMCEEGVTVAVNYPGTTLRAENMIVFDWNGTLNMSNGQNSQTLGCRWDPPELRAGNSTS
jgi:hypothetical protein